MTIAVANIIANSVFSDSFGTWLERTNTLATIATQNAVTVDATFSGSLSTGNGYVNGYFGANTLIARDGIAGGTLTAGNTLNLLTNTAFVYAGANLASFNANGIYSNTVVTTNSIYLVANGGNVTIGGLYILLTANVINVNSGAFYYNGVSTFTGNTFFKSNTTFTVLSLTGNNSDVTVLANTTNTFVVGNTTFANSVNIRGTANVNQLNVYGSANIAGNLRVEGNVVVGGSFAYGNVSFDDINVGNRLILNSISHQFANSYIFTNSTAAANIDTVSASTYRSFEYTIQLSDTTVTPNPYYHMTKLIILHDGTTPYITEYQTLFNLVTLGSFNVLINGGNLALQLTPTTANVVAKFIRTSFVP